MRSCLLEAHKNWLSVPVCWLRLQTRRDGLRSVANEEFKNKQVRSWCYRPFWYDACNFSYWRENNPMIQWWYSPSSRPFYGPGKQILSLYLDVPWNENVNFRTPPADRTFLSRRLRRHLRFKLHFADCCCCWFCIRLKVRNLLSIENGGAW